MFFYTAVLVKLSDFKLTSLCFLSGNPEPLIEPHIETRAEQQARKQAKLEAVKLDLMSPQGTCSAEGADLVVLSWDWRLQGHHDGSKCCFWARRPTEIEISVLLAQRAFHHFIRRNAPQTKVSSHRIHHLLLNTNSVSLLISSKLFWSSESRARSNIVFVDRSTMVHVKGMLHCRAYVAHVKSVLMTTQMHLRTWLRLRTRLCTFSNGLYQNS